MKKFLLITLTVLSLSSFAQPVLKYNSNHSIGTQSIMYMITGNTTQLQQTGGDQLWDLSLNTLTQGGNFDFVDPATTPFGADYPAANLCIKQTVTGKGISYTYLIDSPTELNAIADNINTTKPNVWIKYDKIVQYPLNYTNSYVVSRQSTTGAVETSTRTYDAYGTLMINGKIYTKVIRVTKTPGNSVWFTTTPVMFPILIQGSSSSYFYNEPIVFTGTADLTSINQIAVYPNPAKNKFVVEIPNFDIQNNLNLNLLNVFGQEIKQVSINSTLTTIDIENLAPGVYIYQIKDENKVLKSDKIVVE